DSPRAMPRRLSAAIAAETHRAPARPMRSRFSPGSESMTASAMRSTTVRTGGDFLLESACAAYFTSGREMTHVSPQPTIWARGIGGGQGRRAERGYHQLPGPPKRERPGIGMIPGLVVRPPGLEPGTQ